MSGVNKLQFGSGEEMVLYDVVLDDGRAPWMIKKSREIGWKWEAAPRMMDAVRRT